MQLITGSPTAPGLFLDFSSHDTQPTLLSIAHEIDVLLTENSLLYIKIQYVKRGTTLEGHKQVLQLAFEAVKKPLPNDFQTPTIRYQREETRATAIEAWGQQYYENPKHSQAYNSALVAPPDGHAHMILRIASKGIRKKGRNYLHHVPRAVQSTLTRLITGHAFTGAYRLKFQRKNLPPATEEEVACACGAVLEDTEHVLLHCPLTHEQRLRHLSEDGLPDTLRKLFDSPRRCLGLLRFLEETRVCAKPQRAWEPG